MRRGVVEDQHGGRANGFEEILYRGEDGRALGRTLMQVGVRMSVAV